jgi:hypothetical protein
VPGLTRAVTDVATFAQVRRLPLLFDVLDLGITATEVRKDGSEVDYVIYTNSDICLLPHFYLAVAELIRSGYDVITINRRTINLYPENKKEQIALMYSDYGTDHPGYDCFVFARSIYERFAKNHACIGAGMVMRSLLFNLAACARRFAMLTSAHLTFHIGDDRYWTDRRFNDYVAFNTQQAHQVAMTLARGRIQAEKLAGFMRANGENKQMLQDVERTARIT